MGRALNRREPATVDFRGNGGGENGRTVESQEAGDAVGLTSPVGIAGDEHPNRQPSAETCPKITIRGHGPSKHDGNPLIFMTPKFRPITQMQ